MGVRGGVLKTPVLRKMGQELAKAVIQPLVKPADSCCKYVLNSFDSDCSSGCCSCHLATHAIELEDEDDPENAQDSK